MSARRRTILLVDDEAIIAMAQAEDLEKEGYTVVLAGSGREAIDAVDRARGGIDLVLMDIDLGKGMDGTEAAREILATHDIPVVFLSSHTERAIVEKTEAITSYGYVVKSAGITVLAASIRMAFRLHDAHDRIQAKNMEIEAANEELEAANEELVRSQRDLIEGEKSLAISEERYRCLFEQGSDAIFVADPATRRILDCNRKAEDLTGRTRDELLAMNADLLHTEDQRAPTMEYFREFVLGRREGTVESAVLTGEGMRVPVSISAGVVQAGGKSLLLGIFRDITDRTRIEEALRAQERRLRAVIDGSPVLQFVIDRNHRVLYWNRSLEKYSGIPAGEVIGTNRQWRAFYDHDRPCLADLLVDGLPDEIFRRYKGKCNRSALVEDAFEATDFFPALHGGTWLYFTAAPIRDGDGTIIGALETLADITEQRMAEEAMQESKRYLDEIINSVADPIFVKDREHRWVLVNDAYCDFLGRRREDLLGKSDFDYSPAREAEVFWEKDEAVFTSGMENINEEPITDAQGRVHTAVTKKTLYRNKRGEEFIVGIIRDITERKLAEDRLNAATRQLENILEFLPDATFIIDSDKRVIAWNRAMEEISGLKKDRILGKDHYQGAVPFYGEPRPFLIDLLEEFDDDLAKNYANVKRKGDALYAEAFTPALNGGKGAYIAAVATRLFDAEGRPAGAIESIRDITEWREAETKASAYIGFLERIEAIDRVIREAVDLDAMLGSVLDGVRVMFDSDRAWLLYPCDPGSPTFRVRIMRARPEYPADIALEEDLPVDPETARVLEDVLGSPGPVVFDPSSGRKIPFAGEFAIKSQMVLAVRPRTGQAWAFGMHQCSHDRVWSGEEQRLFLEIGRRVTDGLSSILFLEILRGSEEKYRALVENLNVGIFMSSLDGKFLHVNPATVRLSGLESAEQLLEMPAQSLYDDPEDRQRMVEALARDGHVSNMEIRGKRAGGERFWLSMSAVLMKGSGGEPGFILGTVSDITQRKRIEEALDRRLVALTRPLGDSQEVSFEELFNIEDIQRVQDLFAAATGVASIITHVDGTPITRPSGFCRLCSDIIRTTGKGLANCYHSDAVIGRYHPEGPVVQPCLSGGLWDAGASIAVGGRHIANWLIGQVRDETQSEEKMRSYAREIGAEEEVVVAAFREVPTMSRERFDDVAHALFVFANQLSLLAYQNVQQARIITERREAVDALTRSIAEKEVLLQELRHRVKNSLNIASNLISLKLHDVRDDGTRAVFSDVISRIESIAAVYEQLHAGGSLERVDLVRYVNRLTELLRKSYMPREGGVTIMTVLEKVSCDLRCAVPLGLILNELVTNALKYAYPPGSRGEIRVSLAVRGETVSLVVADDGPGLPGGMSAQGGGLGLRLVEMLCRQIDGTLVIEEGPGTSVRIVFPA